MVKGQVRGWEMSYGYNCQYKDVCLYAYCCDIMYNVRPMESRILSKISFYSEDFLFQNINISRCSFKQL